MILLILDEHERRCGGKFEKIKEPENYKTKGNKKRSANEIISNKNQPSTSNIVSSPSKKKKKTTSGIIPTHGTIESFFKKTNSTSSSTDMKQSNAKKIIDTNSQEQTSTIKSHDDEIKQNYTKCPICQVLLPKANLFIHQVRCYK
jgi:hypothetical protein